MLETYNLEIANKESEEELAEIIKVWSCRKPQKPSMSASAPKAYAKIVFQVSPVLEKPLVKYMLLTGCIKKDGKPPRGYLEREATSLLGKL